jgi:hypothetical protein
MEMAKEEDKKVTGYSMIINAVKLSGDTYDVDVEMFEVTDTAVISVDMHKLDPIVIKLMAQSACITAYQVLSPEHFKELLFRFNNTQALNADQGTPPGRA